MLIAILCYILIAILCYILIAILCYVLIAILRYVLIAILWYVLIAILCYVLIAILCYILQGKPVAAGTAPPDLLSKQLSFVLPVVMDSVPVGTEFGQPITDAQMVYKQVRSTQYAYCIDCKTRSR